MSDWITLPLRDLVATTFSGEWGSDPYPYNARVLRATDITDDMRVNLEGGALRLIPKTKLEEKKLLAGDIILEGSGGSSDKPVGRVAYFDAITSTGDNFIVSNFFRTLRPNNDIVHPKYLYWLLNWFYKQPPLRAMQQQTTGIINLKLQQYLDQLYQLPQCKVEQVKVADTLDALDVQIRETETIIAKLQQVKQGLLHDLLTRGVDENGELRPSYEDAPELYKQSNSVLGFIPKSWDLVSLEEIASVNRGQFTHRPRNDPRFYGGEFPFIQTGDIASAKGGVLTTYTQTLSEKGTNVSLEFPAGTIAITIAANIADTAILGTPMYFPDSIVGAIPAQGISSRFVELSIRRMKKYLDSRAPQSAQKNINLQDLRPLPIGLPTTSDEINKISMIYDELEAQLSAERLAFQKLQEKKSGLMDDLLTGKKRVTDLLNQQAN